MWIQKGDKYSIDHDSVPIVVETPLSIIIIANI